MINVLESQLLELTVAISAFTKEYERCGDPEVKEGLDELVEERRIVLKELLKIG